MWRSSWSVAQKLRTSLNLLEILMTAGLLFYGGTATYTICQAYRAERLIPTATVLIRNEKTTSKVYPRNLPRVTMLVFMIGSVTWITSPSNSVLTILMGMESISLLSIVFDQQHSRSLKLPTAFDMTDQDRDLVPSQRLINSRLNLIFSSYLKSRTIPSSNSSRKIKTFSTALEYLTQTRFCI